MSERKRLVQVGNSQGIVIDVPLLNQLGLKAGSFVDLILIRVPGSTAYLEVRPGPSETAIRPNRRGPATPV
jgi:hypothetical protein